MYLPTYTNIPSESTIEQLSNHHLLNIFGACSSWFFIPTRHEENKLGYDASLQEHKALIIQYKAFHPNIKGGGIININIAQHNQLKSNFPSRATPYAFYAFSLITDYKTLSSYYASNSGCCKFSDDMVFVDIYDIPANSKSFNTASLRSIRHYNLNRLAKMCLSCGIGIRQEYFSELLILSDEENSNLSVIFAHVPRNT